jgi:sec-independent protein translocase protein TatB
VFDLSVTKLLVLAVIALIVFGPKDLPKIASQAGRALRDLRRIAEGAKADLREGLGPEFQNFDFEDLNPRRFVQKHLLDEPVTTPAAPEMAHANGTSMGAATATATATAGAADVAVADGAAVGVADIAAADGAAANGPAANGARPILGAGEDPPFDFEAT